MYIKTLKISKYSIIFWGKLDLLMEMRFSTLYSVNSCLFFMSLLVYPTVREVLSHQSWVWSPKGLTLT